MTVVSCSIDERYVNPLFEVFDGGDLILSSYRDVEDDLTTMQVFLADPADAPRAADALSAARPGARRENVENYIKRLQKLEEVASSFNGVDNCYAIQAGREVRVMVKPEVVNDERMIPLAREICKKIEEELEYPGQIKVNIIRESRATEFAK